MRTYQIYWIRDEFASHFYGREQNFYRLFFERSSADKAKQTIIDKQIRYITKDFSLLTLQQALTVALAKKNSHFAAKRNEFRLDLANNKGTAVLVAEKKHLKLMVDGSYEAEAVFFHALKGLKGRLFAVDFEQKNFGWLQPIKKEILFN